MKKEADSSRPNRSRFQELEHTADIAIRVWGNDLAELFANAAYGMFSLMVDVESLPTDSRHEVLLQAVDVQALLVDWLSHLLTLHDVHREAYRNFYIDTLVVDEGRSRLSAKVEGGGIQEVKIVIKGVTYHDLAIEKTPEGYTTTLVFDI